MEEYYLVKRLELLNALTYNYISFREQGSKDLSDLYRGKLMMLDEFLAFKDIFKNLDELERKIKEQQKGANT